jgi:molybdenum cofactor biosynthesis enzyme MoaA
MSVDHYRTVLTELGQFMDQISLGCIREPLVHPQIREILLATDALRCLNKIELSTNGVLLNDTMNDLLASTKTDLQVTVSIESANPETYARVRRGARLENLQRNLKHLIGKKSEKPNLKVIFSTVIMKTNFDELADLVQFVETMEGDGIFFLQLQLHDGNADLALDKHQQQRVPALLNGLKQRFRHSPLQISTHEYENATGNAHSSQRFFAIMNQTGHLYCEGQRQPIGSIFHDADRQKIRQHYRLT